MCGNRLLWSNSVKIDLSILHSKPKLNEFLTFFSFILFFRSLGAIKVQLKSIIMSKTGSLCPRRIERSKYRPQKNKFRLRARMNYVNLRLKIFIIIIDRLQFNWKQIFAIKNLSLNGGCMRISFCLPSTHEPKKIEIFLSKGLTEQ